MEKHLEIQKRLDFGKVKQMGIQMDLLMDLQKLMDFDWVKHLD